ncbi:hypothetical protein C2E23DRAFT_871375 [Lenzites betulinus]|nr:hypothetical protein C2E23DRAFT_871375 [Lenzites betulinus]
MHQRFKTALENMRYCRCTKEDINLLLTRVCRSAADISIITALNATKAEDFARMCGQQLTSFEFASIRRAQREYTSNDIGPNMQRVLWQLPPTLTEHHSGILMLCRGMPVLLKYNEATELCATNGAEATVIDWHSHSISGGRQVLDVLFVELTNPPRTVQLPGLPVNVIPLTRNKKRVSCTLPANNMKISITREQVMVLPNFAMTDFASQGRTRIYNVVHLKHCKNHQSIYTCLSRSSSLDGTIILDMFDTAKIRGGTSADLRQEFRELELMDDITKMRLDGILPPHVHGTSRAPLLTSFRAWKGARYVPSHVHAAIDWSDVPESEIAPCHDMTTALTALYPSQISGSASAVNNEKNKSLGSSVNARDPIRKRSRPGEQWTSRPTKRPKTIDPTAYDIDPLPQLAPLAHSDTNVSRARVGLVWDCNNWSCAYDSILTFLINLYADIGADLFSGVSPGNIFMDLIRTRLPLCATDNGAPETMRDAFRDVLSLRSPIRFPRHGQTMAAVSDVISSLFYCSVPFARGRMTCVACSFDSVHVVDVTHSYAWYLTPAAFRTHFPGQASLTSSEYIECLLTAGINAHCSTCHSMNVVHILLEHAPPLIALETSVVVPIRAEAMLQLPIGQRVHTWRLAGAIYHGFDHFTMRYVDIQGLTWYHDGDITKNRMIHDVDITNSPSAAANARGRVATHYLYALVQ